MAEDGKPELCASVLRSDCHLNFHVSSEPYAPCGNLQEAKSAAQIRDPVWGTWGEQHAESHLTTKGRTRNTKLHSCL